MKLAFNTWVYSSFPVWVPAYPLEETMKRLARIGYDGIEIGAAAPHAYPEYLGKDRRKELRQVLDDNGIAVSAMLPAPGGGPGFNVASPLAEERRNAIMEAQQAISLRKNRALVGRTLQVLIEAVGEAEDEAGNIEPIAVGRARRHAPEVDGLVFVPGALPAGELIDLTIAEAGPYDLWALPPGQTERAPAQRPPAVRAKSRPRVAATRSRAATRPERRGQGRPVPLATPAGT